MIIQIIKVLYFYFLFTIPFGRIPIATPFSILTLDDLVAVLLFLLLLSYRMKFLFRNVGFDRGILLTLGLFFSWGMITVIFSENIYYTFIEWASYFVYAGIFVLLVFPYSQDPAQKNQFSIFVSFQESARFIYIVTLFVSLLILVLFVATKLGIPVFNLNPSTQDIHWRIEFSNYVHIFPFNILFPIRIDPNSTAVGIALGTTMGLLKINLVYRRNLKGILYNLSFLLPFAVLLIMRSRTAFIIITLPSIIVLIKNYSKFPMEQLKKIKKTLFFALPIFFFVLSLNPQIIQRFINLFTPQIVSHIRVVRYKAAITNIFLSVKNFFVGRGFMIGDPGGNEILRHWEGSGVIGMLLFISLFAVVYKYAIMNRVVNRKTIVAELLFWFIVIAILFTPLTKMLWVALYFIVLSRIDDKAKIIQTKMSILSTKD